MSAVTALAAGQRAAEALMQDTCVIRRRTGETTHPDTGVVTPTYLDPDPYTGRCKVQQSSLSTGGRMTDVAEAALLVVQREVHVPVAASAAVRVDDQVTITAVGPASDPSLLGRVFMVRGEGAKSYLTARRLAIEETTS